MDVVIESSPFPHVRLENFLPAEVYRRLLKETLRVPLEKKDSDLFSLHQSADLTGTSRGALGEFVKTMTVSSLISLVERMAKKKIGKQLDLAISLYGEGDFLLCHDDQLEGRVVAYTYYFNDMPKGSGGELCLYGGGKDSLRVEKKILPKANSLVLFVVSKRSFHSVAEVLKGKRMSLQGWYRGKSSR